jgi:hypothetical protein
VERVTPNSSSRTSKSVDWEKGQHWVGIAGAYTARGIFSVKGTKEVAYAVFNALTDASNGGYQQIRHRRLEALPLPKEDF